MEQAVIILIGALAGVAVLFVYGARLDRKIARMESLERKAEAREPWRVGEIDDITRARIKRQVIRRLTHTNRHPAKW